MRGIETSFTIATDDAYDYNIIGELGKLDPDDLHEELLKHTNNEVCQLMQNLTSARDVAVDDHLTDTSYLDWFFRFEYDRKC